jgi:putative colanic acid biosynthesis acetyltransferase WcaF
MEESLGPAVDLSHFKSSHGLANKVARVCWHVAWVVFFRPSPRPLHSWRRQILRIFGAHVGKRVRIDPSVRVWAPWNLEMGDNVVVGAGVDCYSVDSVVIGSNCMISQYTFICTASHDYERAGLPLVTAPIEIGEASWVAAHVFLAPGVSVGTGSVVGACSVVTESIPPWHVAVGVPAKVIKARQLRAGNSLVE